LVAGALAELVQRFAGGAVGFQRDHGLAVARVLDPDTGLGAVGDGAEDFADAGQQRLIRVPRLTVERGVQQRVGRVQHQRFFGGACQHGLGGFAPLRRLRRVHPAAGLFQCGGGGDAGIPGGVDLRGAGLLGGLDLGDAQASGISIDIWARAGLGNLAAEIIDRELERRLGLQQRGSPNGS